MVTTGGIHGRILEVEATTFLVEIDSNTKMKIEKSCISMQHSKPLNKEKKEA